MSVPLSSRWADIQSVENEHKRLALQMTAYTGLRGRPLLELTWDRVYQVTLEDGREAWAINLDKPVKKSPEDREIVLGDDSGRIIDRLREIQYDDCNWVFPSRRIVGDKRGHLDRIDRFGSTTTNMLRHYWMPIARTHVELAKGKWIALHSMKSSGFGMMGHYGTPSLLDQYDAGNSGRAHMLWNQMGAVKGIPALVQLVLRFRRRLFSPRFPLKNRNNVFA